MKRNKSLPHFKLIVSLGLVISLLSSVYSFSSAFVLSPRKSQGVGVLAAVTTVNPAIDTTSYITNPGMGWQYMGGSNQSLIPETVAYIDRQNIPWKTINPNENEYRWDILDGYINNAAAAGKQTSFRIYSMRGEGFGGHQVPTWAVNKGIKINSGGDPDYANCTYQSEWGKFIAQLKARYDGNPNLAYIDISGYGNFNEWSWVSQTQFDANIANPSTLDGHARKRLIDIFIGGTSSTHRCRDINGNTQTISYNHSGFADTQLIMPYAGIRHNNTYITNRRSDVGFRNDCLGESGYSVQDFINAGTGVADIFSTQWRTAPIVFELCGINWSSSAFRTRMDDMLKFAHGSMVHDNPNGSSITASELQGLMRGVGYRYALKEAAYETEATAGSGLLLLMTWQNLGYAPSYPKMGQDFQLRVYLMQGSQVKETFPISADISSWMPADILPGTAPSNNVQAELTIPTDLPAGTYTLKYGIYDQRTEELINLAHLGKDSAGRYTLGNVEVVTGSEPTLSTPQIIPNGGTFDGSVNVSISTTEPGTIIRYTTDGTTPGTNSSIYTGPVSLTSSKTVKAKAYKTGYLSSLVSTASFTINTTGGDAPDPDQGTDPVTDPDSGSNIAGIVPVHRFLNRRLKIHFYTASESERNFVQTQLAGDWQYEGVAYRVPTTTTGTVPVYRFLNRRLKIHFYTASSSEKAFVQNNLAADWQYEGIAFRAYPTGAAGRKPVYRFLNKHLKIHFYTASPAERDFVRTSLSSVWVYENVAYYAR